TATPVANGGIWRHAAALGEFRPPVLNERQRSVNRKVQTSNPYPGASFEIQNRCPVGRVAQPYYNRARGLLIPKFRARFPARAPSTAESSSNRPPSRGWGRYVS